jgi:ABC-type Fe3+-siderophore transport system permease subunit
MSEENKKNGSFGKGIGLVGLTHFFLLFYAPALLYIGVAQLPYVLFWYLFFRRRGETATCQGVLVGAAITFLLNAACQGLVYMMVGKPML